MYVDANQAEDDDARKLHEDMCQWFGLPEIREQEYNEVIGWYHADQNTRYWVHDPHTGAFRVITTDGQWIRPNLAGDWEEGDLEEIRQCMDHLQFLPRPPLPDDKTVPTRSESFAHEGWLFAWFFVPGLRRWELGVIERRWRVEAKPAVANEDDVSSSTARTERREMILTLATKSFDAGVQLFDRYCKTMLLLGHWEAPDPVDGLRLIRGAASEAAARFSEPTDVVRLVARATGCEEQVVQSVIAYYDAAGFSQQSWFRGAAIEIVMPGLGSDF